MCLISGFPSSGGQGRSVLSPAQLVAQMVEFGLNLGSSHCLKPGMNPWGNERREERWFDCSKCLEVAAKFFQLGLYEIQRVSPLRREISAGLCLAVYLPVSSQDPPQPGTFAGCMWSYQQPRAAGSWAGTAGWCKLLLRIFGGSVWRGWCPHLAAPWMWLLEGLGC